MMIKKDRMRVYISGPISGHEDLNIHAFRSAADKLESEGFEPVVPHDLTIHFQNPVTLSEKEIWCQAMKRDIEELVKCDAVYLLDGWIESRGAKIEAQLAHDLCIPVTDCMGGIRSIRVEKRFDKK